MSKIIDCSSPYRAKRIKTVRNGVGNGYCDNAGSANGDSWCDGYNGRLVDSSGYAHGLGESSGEGYGNGNSFPSGNSYTTTNTLYVTDITDPTSLVALRFFSFKKKNVVSWDQIWTECNDEQKQHLLLFLPLRNQK